MATISELASLYDKIHNGTATQDDHLRYQLGIETSCIDEKFLTRWVAEAAKELTSK